MFLPKLLKVPHNFGEVRGVVILCLDDEPSDQLVSEYKVSDCQLIKDDVFRVLRREMGLIEC